MFRLQDKRERNVFEFSKLFKEFWSEHSHSVVIPSYVVLSRNEICSAILLFRDNSIIEKTLRVLRNGAGVTSFGICVDGDVTNNSVGEVLSVIDIKSDSIVTKLFPYEIRDDFQISWNGELDILDATNFYKFQSILHQESNQTDLQEIISSLGFSEERQYFHSLRFVFSFLEKNENIYIIDLLSPSHPDWVDAEEKLHRLLQVLEKRNLITNVCSSEIYNIRNLLGKASFVHDVEKIVKKHWALCHQQDLVSPAIFAELLHRKIFDYNYDLHNAELISW
jgi:hypothetical protein